MLREEVLDRPPNRWYQSDFLIPSETSLGDRADDAADDEFVFQGQLQAYGASGARRGRSPTIVQVGENGASKVEPMGLG